jgi:hypothetical protein
MLRSILNLRYRLSVSKVRDEVDASTNLMIIGKGKHMDVATSNLRYLYWTPIQQLTHHASAMCGMDTGDLIGTGTISGDVRIPATFTIGITRNIHANWRFCSSRLSIVMAKSSS